LAKPARQSVVVAVPEITYLILTKTKKQRTWRQSTLVSLPSAF